MQSQLQLPPRQTSHSPSYLPRLANLIPGSNFNSAREIPYFANSPIKGTGMASPPMTRVSPSPRSLGIGSQSPSNFNFFNGADINRQHRPSVSPNYYFPTFNQGQNSPLKLAGSNQVQPSMGLRFQDISPQPRAVDKTFSVTPSLSSLVHRHSSLSPVHEDQSKFMKYLENNTAAIEKLADILDEDSSQEPKPRRTLKHKLTTYVKDSMLEEDEIDEYDINRTIKNPALRKNDKRSTLIYNRPGEGPGYQPSQPFTQRRTKALQTIGELYLMGKLPNISSGREKMTQGQLASVLGQQSSRNLNDFGPQNYTPSPEMLMLSAQLKNKREQTREQARMKNFKRYGETRNTVVFDNIKSARSFGSSDDENEPSLMNNSQLKNSHMKIESLPKLDLKKKSRRRKITLRQLLWVMVYPQVLTKDVDRTVMIKKEKVYSIISRYIKTSCEDSQQYIVSAAEKTLRSMFTEAKSLELYSFKKPVPEKIMETRVEFTFTNLRSLLDKMIFRTQESDLSKGFIKFLISISQDYGILPLNFLFEFEIKRLQFNHYGNLKNMSHQRSKMILGFFVLVRILIHKVIMRPWTVFPDISEDQVNKKNLWIFGSILYHIVLNYYRRTVPIQHNNQSFIHPHHRVKTKKDGLKAFDQEPNWPDLDAYRDMINVPDKEGDVITGFLSQDALKIFFVEKRKLVDELKALVECWHDRMYELIQNVYNLMPKKEIGNLELLRDENEDPEEN